MVLKYAEFIKTLLEARGMKKSDFAKLLGVKDGQVYEFLEGTHEPKAGFAKAVEFALEINLRPEFYGWGDPRKP